MSFFRELYNSSNKKFHVDVAARTVLFNSLAAAAIFVQSMCLCFSVTASEANRSNNIAYYSYIHLREPVHVVLLFAFVGSTSSVSLIWLEMSRKAAAIHVQPTAEPMHPSLRFSFGTRPISYQQLVGLVSVAAGGLVVGSYLFYKSTFFALSCGMVFTVIVGISYHIGGRRVNQLLSLVDAGTALEGRNVRIRTVLIANGIRRTSTFMSRSCCALAMSFVAVALTLPSPTPAYKAQNRLPLILSAQIPIFVCQMIFLSINMHIVEYLKFGKRGPPRESETQIPRATSGQHNSSSGPRSGLTTITEEITEITEDKTDLTEDKSGDSVLLSEHFSIGTIEEDSEVTFDPDTRPSCAEGDEGSFLELTEKALGSTQVLQDGNSFDVL